MPELPDIEAYRAALDARIAGATLVELRIAHPFLLRSVEPAPSALAGARVAAIERLGKRLVLAFDGELSAVLHLMIAGRLHWRDARKPLRSRAELAAFDFERGSLVLTEAGTKRRAALWLVEGPAALAAHDPGGLEPLTATPARFAEALTRENHTLKRALADPHLFSGIGNAYSDEILHAAGLSPLALTQRLAPAEIARLHAAVVATLTTWTERLVREARAQFPERVTAFRPEFAVHGRFRQPCPACGSAVQRIAYAEHECNYCARCQTEGRLLADRALSRLLKQDWPRTLEEWERLRTAPSAPSRERKPDTRQR